MLRLVTLVSLACAVAAWTTGSAVSSFGGSVLVTPVPAASSASSLTMKKGKANVPPSMRTQYARQKEMVAMRDEMLAASRPGADGLPVFNLFVRTKKANVRVAAVVSFRILPCHEESSTHHKTQVWYPCGSFKGDQRSAALAKSYADDGLLAGVSKKQIDAGIAGSLYRDQSKLKESVCRAYPQLKKAKEDFEFGYKLAFEGLSDDKAKEIKVIEPKEQKGVLDGIKHIFS